MRKRHRRVCALAQAPWVSSGTLCLPHAALTGGGGVICVRSFPTSQRPARCLLCVHPHQVSSLHSHPTRFHSGSFIIWLLAVAALSPAVFWGIQGSGEVNWEENSAELGDRDAGRLGHVALRGHLSSPSMSRRRMD